MARVVCQVVHRADRVTFVWSEGNAFFEPYSLEGGDSERLEAIAAHARAALARSARSAELAPIGHQLYRAIFRLDAGDGHGAPEIARWLLDLHAKGQVETLEFLGDAPTSIPWNVLYDAQPSGDAPWESFWGGRFNLAAGKRTNPLRLTPPMVKPTAVLAVDAAIVEQVSPPLRSRLDAWGDNRLVIDQAEQLGSRLRSGTPDVLVLLAPVDDGALRIGGQRIMPAQLREWIGAAREGNPNPVIFIGAIGSADTALSWSRWLAAGVDALDGLVAGDVPLPADQAVGAGLAVVQALVEGHRPLAAALADARRGLGAAGLAVSAYGPAGLTSTADEAAESPSLLPTQPLPDYPYTPLAAYGREDRALFFGREEESLRLAALVDSADTAAVMLHGMASVGKTSLVQAGLWPFLEQECVGFRVLCDRNPDEGVEGESDCPPLMLRAGADLIGQLADGIFAFCAQPLTYATPTGAVVTVDLPGILTEHLGGAAQGATSTAIQEAVPPASDTAVSASPDVGLPASPPDVDEEPGVGPRDLWLALREEPARLARLLHELTRRLPFELLVTIDQAEELLTLAKSPSERERRQQAIDMLVALGGSPARCKLLLILRAEYFGQFTGLLPAGACGWKDFYLDELSETGMTDAVLGPTSRDDILYADEAPHSKYGFGFEDGLAQQIVDDVAAESSRQQVGKLALLQAVCAMLYERAVLQKRQQIIRPADLKDIGGARATVARYVSQEITRLSLPRAARDGLKQLIGRLVTKHADGRVTRDLVPARELKQTWRAATPVEEAVNAAADQAGLFSIDEMLVAGQYGLYVSLAHDSVAEGGKQLETGVATGGGRKAVIDTLWIMVPLALLGAAVTFYFTRNYYIKQAQSELEQQVEELKPVFTKLSDYHAASRWPIYRGLLAQAEQALANGNALAARQHLLSEPATSGIADLRGFEWGYLWNKINGERQQLEGHTGTITAVALSADGKRAASASADGTVRLWNLDKGEPAARISVGSELLAVALSRDGKTVAAAGQDKTIRVWDVSGVKDAFVTIDAEPRRLAGHNDAVLALAFDKGGQTLASASADKTVILWDMQSGKERAKLTDHSARVQAVAFAPDGKTLASGAAESGVIVWATDGKKLHTVNSGLDSVSAVAFDPDGKALAVGGIVRASGIESGAIRLWSLKSPTAAPESTAVNIEHGREVLALAYLPGGKAIASAGKDRVIRLWDTGSGKDIGQWVGHLAWVDAIAVAGTTLVSGSFDRTLKVWDTDRNKAEQVLRGHNGWVQAVAFGGSAKEPIILASGGKDGVVKLWDPVDGASLGELAGQGEVVTSLAFAPNKPRILAVGVWNDKGESDVKVWELVPADKGYKGTVVHTLKGHKAGVTCLAFDPSGERLASGSADKTAIVWDLKTGQPKYTLTDRDMGEVRCLSFNHPRILFTAGADKAVRMWDSVSGKLMTATPAVHTDTIMGIDMQEGQGVVTGGLDHTLHLLVSSEGNRFTALGTEHVPNHAMTCLLRRRSFMITGGLDGTVRLWTVESRAEKEDGPVLIDFRDRFIFTGHTAPVRAIALSPDMTAIASASQDGTVRLWRTAAMRPVPAAKGKAK